MRIQHNIAALNSYRNLTNNNSAVSKNLEKLSSGYRINRAGDDAAGLAISEKMRAQITGLETAQKNANDGISLIQTAEGALTEVHSMLNRMVELANQSANGTYQNEVDRTNLQSEMKALKDEIDRIADATNFNGINLLDGSLGGTSGKALEISGTKGGLTITGTPAQATAATMEIDLTGFTGVENGKTYNLEIAGQTVLSDATGGTAVNDLANAFDGKKVTIDNVEYTIGAAAGKLTLTAADTGAVATVDTSNVNIKKGDASVDPTGTATATFKNGLDAHKTYDLDAGWQAGDTVTIDGKTYTYDAAADGTDGEKFKDLASLKTAAAKNGVELDTTTATAVVATTAATEGNGLTLQIGDTSADFNQMTVSVEDMHAAALGIADIDISTQAGAQAAVDLIKTAINTVSSTRGDLGALQNRLEHTINNLSVTTENMTAAESRIRDVDMAEEMMAYTKNNILVQASQAMLAQANQIPQGILQLLQ